MTHASIPAEQVRRRLLCDGLSFARSARHIAGVLRIALIGSLASTKVAPKDIDFLITVADEIDLSLLATAGRRLKGQTQSYNCGADIFLANEDHRYIGRICHWKDCRPGVRASCDARNCGRRPFLHDDLDDVCLSESIVSAPPLELWPSVFSRVALPLDVENYLVSQWRTESPVGEKGAA